MSGATLALRQGKAAMVAPRGTVTAATATAVARDEVEDAAAAELDSRAHSEYLIRHASRAMSG